MFVITQAIKKWHHYLLGHQFTILTNQKSLRELASQTIQTPKQEYWLSKLVGYDFEIRYRPGHDNVVANALSQVELIALQPINISCPHFDLIEDLKKIIIVDPKLVAIQAQLEEALW